LNAFVDAPNSQAEDQAGYGFGYADDRDDPASSDSDYGGGGGAKKGGKRGGKRAPAKKAAKPKPAPATQPAAEAPSVQADAPDSPGGEPGGAPAAPAPAGGGDGLSATGRRRRKDTGQARSAARAWSADEERLFLESLALHGRDWKACAAHVGSRDHRAVASHAQKYLIKALLRGEELPGRMAESGRGFTLSGRPLDPNSAAARAYGLRPEGFKRARLPAWHRRCLCGAVPPIRD
jgi:protein MYSM1